MQSSCRMAATGKISGKDFNRAMFKQCSAQTIESKQRYIRLETDYRSYIIDWLFGYLIGAKMIY